MSNDSIDASDISENVSSDNIETNTNYSRWMTDMAADIAHLKLHQLAIPGAHNSGVDKDGRFHAGKKWAACQYKSFAEQLAAGARYLDLRLVDASYKKDSGGSNMPNYKFVEIFEFAHGGVAVGRQLHHLVEAVNNFASSNPGEIIFIDFHHYDRGRNYAYNSLERCLPKFSPIKNRLIPPSASTLSIGAIREKHPGCNIVLCLNHAYPKPVPANPGEQPPPDKWPGGTIVREQIWNPLRHEWREEASEDNIKSLVIDLMKSPPQRDYWVLSATVTEQTFPKDLVATNPIRTEAFKPGFQNIKILMVDFIDGSNARTSVVDRCITLNRLRAVDNVPPSVPTNLSVKKIMTEESTNSFEVRWDPSTDNLGLVHYEVYKDEAKLATTNDTHYRIRYLVPHTNHTFKVRAFDFLGTPSAFTPLFKLEQDTTSPTIPGNFRVSSPGFTKVYLAWDFSSDESGISGYELLCNGEVLAFTNKTHYLVINLVVTEAYSFAVRAKDMNGLYSAYATLTLQARPVLKNPKVTIIQHEPSNNSYRARLTWDKIEEPQFPIGFYYHFRGYVVTTPHTIGETIPSIDFRSHEPGGEITFNSFIYFQGVAADSGEEYIYTFTFDPTPPEKITNLKLTSRTPASTSITWSPSTSTNVSNYAISLNEQPPTLVPASVNSYVFEQLPMSEDFLIEVWAVSSHAEPSTVESIITGPPGKPGAIQVSNINITTASLYWEHSTSNDVTGYEITLSDGSKHTTQNNRYIFTELIISTSYTVEVRAVNFYGRISEPSTTSFNTNDTHHPSKPGTPIITNNSGSSVTVSWLPSTDNVAVTAYEVILDSDPLILVSANSHIFNGLKDKTAYTVHVRARDAAGNRSEQSSTSFTTKDITPPSPPGRFSITNITSSNADIHWMASTGDVAYYELTIGSRQPIYISTNSTFSTGLTEGTLYSVMVRAQDAVGNFSAPSFDSFTTKTTRPPGKPGSPVASDITDTSARLNWTSAEGLNVTYRVSLNGSVVVEKLGQLHLNVRSLQSGTEQVVEVVATNEAGASEASSTSFRTLPPGPSNFRYTQPADETILEWDAPSESIEPVTGYRVTLINPDGREFNYSPTAPTMRERLPAKIRYGVRITARSAAGVSAPLVSEFTTK